MSRKLVIMTSQEGREALRNCGVLPPSIFKAFDEIDDIGDWGDRDTGKTRNTESPALPETKDSSLNYYLWPYEPDYACQSPGYVDFPILSMLGMPQPKTNMEYLERKIAYTKLLGSTILHVALLDKWDPYATANQPIEECYFSAIEKWCDNFQLNVCREYAEEQAAGIEHVLIFVLRNPNGVKAKKEEVESFCRRLNGKCEKSSCDTARIRTCFFMDGNLEIEQSGDFFPSFYVWPQMVGRLLLRVLLGFSDAVQDDPLDWCDGGVRLWKASELVFGFAQEKVHKLMIAGIGNFLDTLSIFTPGKISEIGIKPWQPMVQQVLTRYPEWLHRGKDCDWNQLDAKACCLETFDDSKWEEVMNLPHVQDGENNLGGESYDDGNVDYERQKLTLDIHSSLPSVDSVVEAVSKWIDAKSKLLTAFFTSQKDSGVSRYWNEVVHLTLLRAKCKDVLGGFAETYDVARGHYVRRNLCKVAGVAVSVCAGLVFGRIVQALGGSVVFSICLGVSAFTGGVCALLAILFLQDRFGKKAQGKIHTLCDIADKCISGRDKGARDQIALAVEMRVLMLRLAKMRHFQLLISRLQRMVGEELRKPSSEVLAKDDIVEKDRNDQLSKDVSDQCDRFFAKTRLCVKVPEEETVLDMELESGIPKKCEKVVENWKTLCDNFDPNFMGNFPACYFVPFLRRMLQGFGNDYRQKIWKAMTSHSLSAEVVAICNDLNFEANSAVMRVVRDFADDDFCYSAHVDFNHKKSDDRTELYYADLFNDRKLKWEALGVCVNPSSLLLHRTPHFAFLFEQASVNLMVDSNGRLRLDIVSYGKGEADE